MPSVSSIINKVKREVQIHENYLNYLINSELDVTRQQILDNGIKINKEQILNKISDAVIKKSKSSFVNIINGTGIVLHTGFGRAPFSGSHLKNVSDKLDGYSSLEYDLEKNIRGDRQSHIDKHIASICGSQNSLIVNNNAAALLLIINSLADNAEVICSRGQIVEIGGSFRISEIIRKGGGVLKEVGSTNRTHKSDYENAVSEDTKLILWVHTSNYTISGYTKEVSLDEMVSIGQKHNIPVVADLGSGSILEMDKYGIPSELPVKEIVKKKPDVTLFSGDKMLGGPQSGIILSSNEIINLIKSNSIYRTVRCDKITIALLDDIIRSFEKNGFLKTNLSLELLTQSRKDLMITANYIIDKIPSKLIDELGIKIIESMVEAGSGSLPEKNIRSIALKFKPSKYSVNHVSDHFRRSPKPIIGYIRKESYFIDLKAVLPHQKDNIVGAIKSI